MKFAKYLLKQQKQSGHDGHHTIPNITHKGKQSLVLFHISTINNTGRVKAIVTKIKTAHEVTSKTYRCTNNIVCQPNSRHHTKINIFSIFHIFKMHNSCVVKTHHCKNSNSKCRW